MAVLYSGDEIVVGQMDTASLDLRNPNRRHSIVALFMTFIRTLDSATLEVSMKSKKSSVVVVVAV